MDEIEYLQGYPEIVKDFDLDNIKKILALLGNPEKKLRCLHVAGTNGKGSVCAMIATVLTEAGYRTGLRSLIIKKESSM